MASNKNHATVLFPWHKDLQGQLDTGSLLVGGTIGDIASQPQMDGVIRIQPSAELSNQGRSTTFPPIFNSSLALVGAFGELTSKPQADGADRRGAAGIDW